MNSATPGDDEGHDAALAHAVAAAGLDGTGAYLIHHYSNAVYALPAERAVARIATGRDVLDRVRRTQAVTKWLVDHHGFPATEPLSGTEAIAVGPATVVSFWVYYPQPEPTPQVASAQLGSLLRQLHSVGSPPIELAPWVPLVSLEATLADPYLARALSNVERDWLIGRITEIRADLSGVEWPLGRGLVHGDAWAGNLLWAGTASTADHVVLGDWDWVSDGPREIDLIPTWHAAVRYGRGQDWIDDFVISYGHDLNGWSGYRPLLAMRDLMQITGPLRRANDEPRYRESLRQRLASLRAGDMDSPWRAL